MADAIEMGAVATASASIVPVSTSLESTVEAKPLPRSDSLSSYDFADDMSKADSAGAGTTNGDVSFSFATFMAAFNGSALFAPRVTFRAYLERKRRVATRPPPEIDGYEFVLIKGARRRGVLDMKAWVVLVINSLLFVFKLALLCLFGIVIAQGVQVRSGPAVTAASFLEFFYALSLIGVGLGNYGIWLRSIKWATAYLVYLSITMCIELALEGTVYVLFVIEFPGPQDLLQRNTIFMVFVTTICQMVVVVLVVTTRRALLRMQHPETTVKVRRLNIPESSARMARPFVSTDPTKAGHDRLRVVHVADSREAIVSASEEGNITSRSSSMVIINTPIAEIAENELGDLEMADE